MNGYHLASIVLSATAIVTTIVAAALSAPVWVFFATFGLAMMAFVPLIAA